MRKLFAIRDASQLGRLDLLSFMGVDKLVVTHVRRVTDVTVGLASHWPCVADTSTYSLNNLLQGDEHPTYTPSVVWHTFTMRCYASAAYAVMRCLSVRLSRSWILSKLISISSEVF